MRDHGSGGTRTLACRAAAAPRVRPATIDAVGTGAGAAPMESLLQPQVDRASCSWGLTREAVQLALKISLQSQGRRRKESTYVLGEWASHQSRAQVGLSRSKRPHI